MSKSTKNNVLKTIANVGKKSAMFGGNSASIFGFHQPKQPAVLNKKTRAK